MQSETIELKTQILYYNPFRITIYIVIPKIWYGNNEKKYEDDIIHRKISSFILWNMF